MGYKSATQVLKKADALKLKVSARNQDLLNDLQIWTDQQQLQTIYHQVLVLDLEYALDKKVEQDLWTIGFKNHISMLQEQARDKKNVHRSELQGLLSWCLEAGTGFYLTLLQEICSTYDLDLPFRKRGPLFGQSKSGCYEPNETVPQPSSCLYICQYCLVHLGDIARYRNQRQQAESFYKHAILVAPNSGHPYNQLALLEASQGDKLSTVYQYIRGIAVKSPFPGATTNLTNTLSMAIDKEDNLQDMQTKMSVNEFIGIFLKAHALLHTHSNLNQAEICIKSLNATLTALVATQSFTKEQLIKITVINMFALHHIGDNDLTADEKLAKELALNLLAGSLSAFLLPVYTLKDDSSIVDYYALAAIRLIMMWIKSKPDLLQEYQFTSRLQIWPGYCKLLNNLSLHLDKKINFNDLNITALSYDRELEGFIPLQGSLSLLSKGSEKLDAIMENQMQAFDLISYGKWLTTFDVNDTKLVISSGVDNVEKFEPGCIQPDPTDKLLEEMKSFKISEVDGNKLKVPERKGGILKPQGSLEKSREERGVKITGEDTAHLNAKVDPVKIKRATQNVALQSIYKKIEENKQVKFSTETSDKTSPGKSKQSMIMPPTNPMQNPNISSYRTYPPTNSFINHLGTKLDNKPNDYFTSYAPQQSQQAFMDNMHDLPPNMQNANINSYTMNNIQPIQKPMGGKMPTPSGSFYGIPPFNNREERPPNNWWPNQQPPQQNMNTMFKQPMGPNYGQQHHEPPNYNYRPQQQHQQDYYMFGSNNHFGNSNNAAASQQDMFNSPWSAPGRVPGSQQPHGSGPASGIMPPMSMMDTSKHSLPPQSNISNSAPGYSLFNTTSWSPSLPLPGGQMRNNEIRSPPQHSLFTGSAPQSLQQLVEQQKQLRKGDT